MSGNLLTRSRFSMRIFSGGHFFVNTVTLAVVAAVQEELRACRAAA